MPTFLTSTVINAPIEKVWAIMRDFGALKSYYANVDTVTLDEGSTGDQIGAVRTLVLKNGSTLKERLVALSDIEYFGTYEVMVDGTPFENVVGTYRLYPITDCQATYVAWKTTFDVKSEPAPIEGFRTFLANDVVGNCLDGVKLLAAS